MEWIQQYSTHLPAEAMYLNEKNTQWHSAFLKIKQILQCTVHTVQCTSVILN